MKLRMPEMPSATLLAALEGYNLLPAIVFLPTRRRCDQAASEAALTRRDPNDSVAKRDAISCAPLSNSIRKCVVIVTGTRSFAAVSRRIMPVTFPRGNS